MTGWDQYVQLVQVNTPSLVAAAALAVAASIVGVFVLLRQEALLALALPQAVAVGAAVGMRADWVHPVIPALGSAGVALLVVSWSRMRHASHLLLPVLYVGGLSISVLIITNSAAHLHEVQHLLSGADVFVTETEAWWAAAILPMLGILCAVLWRRWLLLAQNPTAARLAGLHPPRWEALFLFLLAAMVVFGTSTSGILMVLAMLFLPASAALPWTRRIPATLIASIVIGLTLLAAGFVLSVEMEWPLSQSVGGVGFVGVLASHGLSAILPIGK